MVLGGALTCQRRSVQLTRLVADRASAIGCCYRCSRLLKIFAPADKAASYSQHDGQDREADGGDAADHATDDGARGIRRRRDRRAGRGRKR